MATKRASVSRRATNLGSPNPRSRSHERSTDRDSQRDIPLRDHLQSEDSERIVTMRLETHRRSVSDPFDAEEDQDFKTLFRDAQPECKTLATFPRFPIGDNRDLNCWSEPPIDIFHVRGPNYLSDKKKIESGPFLLKARGCDLFMSDDPPMDIGSNPNVLGGALRKTPTFIVNFRFPWGVLAQYFEIPEKFTPFLESTKSVPSMKGFTPAEMTLAKFFQADEATKNNSLKMIPYIAEGPWIVRNMVTGKPVIIGTKLPVKYTQGNKSPDGSMAEYVEANLDIGNSSAAAKRIVSVCRRYMNALTLDVGFVIQGNTVEELPEQMLCAIRVHRADPLKAPTLTNG